MIAVANHLWQSTLFALVAGLLALMLQKNAAAVRHWVWLASSVKFLVPFSLLMSLGSQVDWRPAPVIVHARMPSIVAELGQPFAPAAPVSRRAAAPTVNSRIPAILFGVWFCGFAVGVLGWTRQWRLVRSAVRRGSSMDLGTPIPVVTSPARLEPGVFGIRRPVLLLPAGITDRLPAAQLTAILVHELSHVRRRDNLAAAVHMLVEAIFWFHPAVWWIGARLMEERERACDEEVLRTASDPQAYAAGILNVCRHYLQSPIECVAGVTGSNLNRRIESILENRRVRPLHPAGKALLAAVAAGCLLGPIAIGLLNAPLSFAQAPVGSLPEFDVASVKVFRPGSAPEDRHISAVHGVLTARQQSLRECIEWAYGLKDSAELTGPGLLDEDEYDILAKTKDGTGEDQIRLMLQRLLVDRFKLSLHRRTEQKPVYSLVVGKNGLSPRMKLVDREPERGFHVDFGDGVMTYGMVGRMEKLVRLLPTFLDAPLVDKTSFPGVYELQLKVQMDDPRPRLPQAGQVFHGFGLTPGVFPAVEELGLKLVKEKGPVEILVVDRVERPSAN